MTGRACAFDGPLPERVIQSRNACDWNRESIEEHLTTGNRPSRSRLAITSVLVQPGTVEVENIGVERSPRWITSQRIVDTEKERFTQQRMWATICSPVVEGPCRLIVSLRGE